MSPSNKPIKPTKQKNKKFLLRIQSCGNRITVPYSRMGDFNFSMQALNALASPDYLPLATKDYYGDWLMVEDRAVLNNVVYWPCRNAEWELDRETTQWGYTLDQLVPRLQEARRRLRHVNSFAWWQAQWVHGSSSSSFHATVGILTRVKMGHWYLVEFDPMAFMTPVSDFILHLATVLDTPSSVGKIRGGQRGGLDCYKRCWRFLGKFLDHNDFMEDVKTVNIVKPYVP